MFFYLYREYSATQTGTIEKHVPCEKCGCNFSYEAVRRTMGFGHSPYGLRNKAALAEASNQAGLKLEKKLKSAVDPVPCPRCGWYQQHMVKELRRRDLRWMMWTGWVGATLAWASAVMALLASTQAFSQPLEANQGSQVLGLIAVGLTWVISFVGGRKLLGARINPNRNDTPCPPAGADRLAYTHPGFAFNPALAQETAGPATAPACPRTGAGADEWVTVQLAKFQCPERCCSCMAQTRERKNYTCGKLAKISVPLCRQCARRYMWKHGLAQIKAAAAGVVIAVAAAAFTPRAPGAEVVLYPAFALAGLLVGALVGVPIANRVAQPVALGRFHAELNTLRLRFANVNYLRSFPEIRLV